MLLAMDTLVLEASSRELSEKAKAVRAKGLIPAVYYGRGQKNQHVALNYQKFRKVFAKAGENTIIELTVDSKTRPVLVHDVQYDPVTDVITHVDFIHVDMQKEVTTMVKVVTVGVAPAVKELGGVLDVQKHELKIKCLPKDLIHAVEVDISPIVDFHTTIHVKDIKVPNGITVLDSPEDTVATVSRPRTEEETKPAEAAVPVEGQAPVPGQEGAAATPAPGAPAAGAKEAKK